MWATTASTGFQEVVSAGRDGSVCATSIQSGTTAPLIAAAAVVDQRQYYSSQRLLAPLNLALTADDSRLWMSTTCADVCEWPVDLRGVRGEQQQQAAATATPARRISGLPGLVRHAVLHNR